MLAARLSALLLVVATLAACRAPARTGIEPAVVKEATAGAPSPGAVRPGAGLIGTDAGSVRGPGAGLIGTDAGSAKLPGGTGLVGTDAGSVIGQNGGGLVPPNGGGLIPMKPVDAGGGTVSAKELGRPSLPAPSAAPTAAASPRPRSCDELVAFEAHAGGREPGPVVIDDVFGVTEGATLTWGTDVGRVVGAGRQVTVELEADQSALVDLAVAGKDGASARLTWIVRTYADGTYELTGPTLLSCTPGGTAPAARSSKP